jgi:hypothetical protein
MRMWLSICNQWLDAVNHFPVIVTLPHMRHNRRHMTSLHRRDGHGIRIDDALWTALETCAHAEHRSRTAWALVVLRAATSGRLVALPHALATVLRAWAARERVSVTQLVVRLLEEAVQAHGPRRK